VLGHDAPFGVVEGPGLVEDLVRDRELADVVQQRAVADGVLLGGGERPAVGDVGGERDDLLGVVDLAEPEPTRSAETRSCVTSVAVRACSTASDAPAA
jgi:hypothetical protein